eukprot:gene12326-15497_t
MEVLEDMEEKVGKGDVVGREVLEGMEEKEGRAAVVGREVLEGKEETMDREAEVDAEVLEGRGEMEGMEEKVGKGAVVDAEVLEGRGEMMGMEGMEEKFLESMTQSLSKGAIAITPVSVGELPIRLLVTLHSGAPFKWEVATAGRYLHPPTDIHPDPPNPIAIASEPQFSGANISLVGKLA